MGGHDFIISPYKTLTIKKLLWEGNDSYVMWPGSFELVVDFLLRENWLNFKSICNVCTHNDKPKKYAEFFVNILPDDIIKKCINKKKIKSRAKDIWPLLRSIHKGSFFDDKTVVIVFYEKSYTDLPALTVRIHDADILTVSFKDERHTSAFFRIISEYLVCDTYNYRTAWLTPPRRRDMGLYSYQ